eukprot:GABV01002024.1.p2 GENE.GABV01002024.1~~GABV01002024.1.p2  ORF type:complete len:126 (+),score=27.23 GABV01002024.1:335-712(+)
MLQSELERRQGEIVALHRHAASGDDSSSEAQRLSAKLSELRQDNARIIEERNLARSKAQQAAEDLDRLQHELEDLRHRVAQKELHLTRLKSQQLSAVDPSELSALREQASSLRKEKRCWLPNSRN